MRIKNIFVILSLLLNSGVFAGNELEEGQKYINQLKERFKFFEKEGQELDLEIQKERKLSKFFENQDVLIRNERYLFEKGYVKKTLAPSWYNVERFPDPTPEELFSQFKDWFKEHRENSKKINFIFNDQDFLEIALEAKKSLDDPQIPSWHPFKKELSELISKVTERSQRLNSGLPEYLRIEGKLVECFYVLPLDDKGKVECLEGIKTSSWLSNWVGFMETRASDYLKNYIQRKNYVDYPECRVTRFMDKVVCKIPVEKSESDSYQNFHYCSNTGYCDTGSPDGNFDLEMDLEVSRDNISRKKESAKVILYQVFGFARNYQKKIRTLSPGSDEYEKLKLSFLWGKKQILEKLLPAIKDAFDYNSIDSVKNYLESISLEPNESTLSLDKSLDPETGRWAPGDFNRVNPGERTFITLKPIESTSRVDNSSRDFLRSEMSDRRFDRMMRDDGYVRERDFRTAGRNGWPSRPSGESIELTLLKENIWNWQKKVSQIDKENQDKADMLGSPISRRESHVQKYSDWTMGAIVQDFAIRNLIENPLLSLIALAGIKYTVENPIKTSIMGSIFMDTPYDLADFFSAMAFDQTLTGQDAGTSDKVILGAMVLIPGVSGKIAREGVDLAKKFAKYGFEGLEEIGKVVSKKSLDDVLRVAEELEIVGTKEIKQNIKILERWEPHYIKVKIEDAAEVNAREFLSRGYEPAYKEGTRVMEFRTTKFEDFVRVHGSENAVKHWIMKAEDIKGLSALEIKNKYNLKDLPTRISRVKIPDGVNIRIGSVGPNSLGNGSGAVQYEVLDRVDNSWFEFIGEL